MCLCSGSFCASFGWDWRQRDREWGAAAWTRCAALQVPWSSARLSAQTALDHHPRGACRDVTWCHVPDNILLKSCDIWFLHWVHLLCYLSDWRELHVAETGFLLDRMRSSVSTCVTSIYVVSTHRVAQTSMTHFIAWHYPMGTTRCALYTINTHARYAMSQSCFQFPPCQILLRGLIYV